MRVFSAIAKNTLVRIACVALVIVVMNVPWMSDARENTVNDFKLGYSLKTIHDVDFKDAAAALSLWSKEIGITWGYRVESNPYEDPLRLVEDLQEGKVDFGIFRSEDYVRFADKIGFDNALVPLRGGKKTHRFLLLVRSDSPVRTLRDLRNKTICFLAGDLAARIFVDTLLSRQKLQNVEGFFSAVYVKQKVSQAILSVFFGQADAVVSHDTGYQTMIELNPQIGTKLRVLHSSPEYVTGLGVFRKGYEKEKKDTVRDSLLGLSDSPRGRQVLMLFKADRFVPLHERELDSVKKLISEHEQTKTRK